MAQLAPPAPRDVPGARVAVTVGAAVAAVGFGYAAAHASSATVLVAAAASATTAAVLWRPAIGALLFIALVAGVPEGTLSTWDVRFEGGGIQVTDGLLALTLGAWLLHAIMRPRSLRMPSPWMTVLILAVVVAAVASLFTAHANGTPFKLGLTELRPILGFLLVFPLVSGARSLRSIEIGLTVLLVAAAATGVEIIVRYVLGLGGVATYTTDSIRIGDVSFLYPLFALIWAFVLLAYPARPRTRLLLLVLAAISSAALIVTFQRGAWLAALLVLPFALLLLRRGGRTRALMFAIPVLAAGMILFFSFNSFSVAGSSDPLQATADRFISLSSVNRDASSEHRIAEWGQALREIRQAPVTGIGLGSSITFSSPLFSPVTGRKGYTVSTAYVHGSYIWAPLKLGIPGALAFFLLIAVVAVGVFRAYRGAGNVRSERLAVGALATLAAMAFAAVAGPHLNTLVSIGYLAALIAGIETLRRLEQPSEQAR